MATREDLLELRSRSLDGMRVVARRGSWTRGLLVIGAGALAPACRGSAPHASELAATPAPVESNASGAGAEAPALELDARRLELARALAAEPGWNLFPTAADFIATPVDDPLLVEEARRRVEAMRARLARELPPAGPHHAPTLVRIHPDRGAFERAGGRPGTTSFWDAERSEVVLFDAGPEEERRRLSWPALQHILVHEHLGRLVDLERTPPWLLYGLAAEAEALELAPGGELLPPVEGRWRALARETAGAGPPPLERFLAFDREEFEGRNAYGSGAWRNLVLAGSWIAFLREQGPPDLLAGILAALQEGAEAPEALREGLDGASLAELDAAWRGWIEARTGRSLPPE